MFQFLLSNKLNCSILKRKSIAMCAIIYGISEDYLKLKKLSAFSEISGEVR